LDESPPVALVNSDAQPYWMDIADMLFAPDGYDYSSRYRWRWVHDDIEPQKLKGKRALLVFLGESQGQSYYLPLREALITDISDHGPFVVIRYRLGRFVDLGPSAHQYTVDFDVRLRRGMQSGNIGVGKEGHLVFPFAQDDIRFSSREVDNDHNWTNLVREVARSAVFKDSVFLRFDGLVDDESEERLTMEEGRFRLRSGRVYKIDIVQYLPEKDGEGRTIAKPKNLDFGSLELETMEMHINSLEEKLDLLGRYDDHTFYIVCERLHDRAISRVAVVGKGTDGTYVPSLVFQVEITQFKLIFVGYIGFLAGLLFICISTVIPGTELILAAAGSVISTAGLIFLER
jgi:hypothetical protein